MFHEKPDKGRKITQRRSCLSSAAAATATAAIATAVSLVRPGPGRSGGHVFADEKIKPQIMRPHLFPDSFIGSARVCYRRRLTAEGVLIFFHLCYDKYYYYYHHHYYYATDKTIPQGTML